MVYEHNEEEAEAANLLALARQTHDAHVAAAKVRAEKIVEGAESQAAEILGNAHEELSWLEEKLEKHRDLEANYRAALKGYLSDLLAELSDDDEFISTDNVTPIHVPDLQIPDEFEGTKEDERVVEESFEEEAREDEEETHEELAEEESQEEDSTEESSDEAAFEEETHENEESLGEALEVETWEDEGGSESPEAIEEVAEETTEAEEDSDEIEDSEEDDDPSDDLPPVPDFIEANGTASAHIAGLDNDDDSDNDDENEAFDALIAGEPKPATDAISLEEETEHKGSRGFFGLGKH